MLLYTVGPVQMFEHTLNVAGEQLPYFRTPQFSEVVLESQQLLKEISGAKPTDKTIFLTASGTAAMEATVMNCFTPEDKLLVINGGSFGRRFVDLCQHHEIPHITVEVPFGEKLTEQMLTDALEEDVTGILVNIHETSTGQLYDAKMLSSFAKNHDILFIVDAISAFIADPLNFHDLGIDAMILSSQKALALSPGLSIVILSERMYEQRVKDKPAKTLYLDFNSHIDNGLRGQTPFTPAVGILLELHDMLKTIANKGIAAHTSHIQGVAHDFRKKVTELGIKYPEYPLSNALTPLLLKDGQAPKLFDWLRTNHQVELNPNGGDLGQTLIRVGHIGDHTFQTNDYLIDLISQFQQRTN